MNRELSAELVAAANQRTKERQYWLNQLCGEPAKGRLPFDFEMRSTKRSSRCVTFELPGDINEKLLDLGKGNDYTLHIILTAGVILLLHKYSGADDILTATPIYRQERMEDFLNTILTLRTRLYADVSFKELLLQLKDVIAEAVENYRYPVELLADLLQQEDTGTEFPLFDVMIFLENIQDRDYFRHIHTDIVFAFNRSAGAITGTVEYNGLRYLETTIRSFICHFVILLKQALQSPGAYLARCGMLSGEEQKRILAEFNETAADYPVDKTLSLLFEEQAEKSPDRTAVIAAGRQLSYDFLNNLASRLAHRFARSGIAPGSIAGIMLYPSIEMVAGLFGILKIKAIYLPIEPSYPVERIRYMLAESGAGLLLTRKDCYQEAGMFEDGKIETLYIEEFAINAAEPGNRKKQYKGKKVGETTGPAYIIYTSGSTGNPKGVVVEHRAVTNILWGLHREYPLNEKGVYLFKTSFMFDVSVTEIFGWYFGGGRLAVLEKGAEKEPSKISAAVQKNTVTHINFVPAMFNVFLDYIEKENIAELATLKYIFLAGEALFPHTVNRFAGSGSAARLENLYGPTEGTIYTARFSLSSWNGSGNVPIGKPLWNIRMYIVDKNLNLLPIGTAGELVIAGDCLARGYLNRPELTAEKFTARDGSDDVKALTRQIVYRTGDLARRLPDGNIDFLGRIDDQVKIRGFRVELGEIESRILGYEDITGTVVVMDEENDGEKYLCAYYTAEREISAAVLRDYLLRELPGFMIPAYFIKLAAIPLLLNGKLNRKALPKPEKRDEEALYVGPRNVVESKLVRLWTEVLSLSIHRVGINDNFFVLGGHSLKATKLVSLIHKNFGVEFELKEIFEQPTIAEQAGLLGNSEILTYSEVNPTEKREYYDLSYAQRRLWIICQFEEDATAYNLPGAFVVSGQFCLETFERAISYFVERHESLRTAFIRVDGLPRQKINEAAEIKTGYVDLRNRGAGSADEARNLYISFADKSFDLERGPLFKTKIIHLAENKYLLLFNIHHIITDGWSQGILLNEIFHFYNTCLSGQTNFPPPLKLQYKDYSLWFNGLIETGHFKKAEAYWLEKFKDKPGGIELPIDHPRGFIQTFNGGRVISIINPEEAAALLKIAREEDATLFMVFLTLLSIFLYKYTGQRDVIIGSPIAGRRKPELGDMIGFLVNTLVYRIPVNPKISFGELLGLVKNEALACYENQDYPFDLLVESLELDRDVSLSPLFNVMLAHNNADNPDVKSGFSGAELGGYTHIHEFNMSKFDLIFFMDESAGSISVRTEYNSDLFDRGSIERMSRNFSALISGILEDKKTPIKKMACLDAEEYKHVTVRFNDNDHMFPPLTIRDLFENRVETSKDRAAVIDDDKIITYRELNCRGNRLARYLREECSVFPGHIVGVSIDRSIEMIIVILAIIKSGAGYVAVDPGYPQERVQHMLDDSGVSIVLVDGKHPGLYKDYRGDIFDLEHRRYHIEQKSAENLFVENHPEDILYVIYTSGSTGTPNGAMLSHGILSNLVRWQNEKSEIDGSMSCLQFTSINFCVSFQEMMTTLTAGGKLILIGEIERRDIDYLGDFLVKFEVENLYLPFSYLNFLFSESECIIDSFTHNLKNIITAGEQLKLTSGLKRFLERNPGVKLHNHYGSSEMHVVTAYTLDKSGLSEIAVQPVGKPITNVKIYILDEFDNPVPIGVWGEICARGSMEIPGYVNNRELTEEKLFMHPIFSPDGMRLYRSGDIGRWLENGVIELRGRKDRQIKIRGFRVEPGEVESKLLWVKGIKDSVVTACTSKEGRTYLAAYVVGENLNAGAVKREIAGYLPQYMLPEIVIMEQLPLMPNGKVDRERLPEPELHREGEYVPPGNAIEEKIAEIWAEVLSIEKEKISRDADFFSLGGHSLKATILTSRMHRVLDVKVPLRELFKNPTISGLAEYISGSVVDLFTTITPVEKKEYYKTSSAQKRLYFLQQFNPDSTAYNMPLVLSLHPGEGGGQVRPDELIKPLISCFESFRTSFELINEEPVQRIHDRVDFKYNDCRKAGKAGGIIASDYIIPFDLSRAPLLRSVIIRHPGSICTWLLDMHHIISDGISLGVVARSIEMLSRGSELPGLRIQYKDYAEWPGRRGDKKSLEEQALYWLSEYHEEAPVLHLPYDYTRPAERNYTGSIMKFAVNRQETEALYRVAGSQGATLFMILLAAYNILLAKLSGQEDIIIGTPTAGRGHDDLENIVGMFINTLALRNRPNGEKKFSDFLQELRDKTLSAFENQEYPFEELVEKIKLSRDISRNPVFDVMFVVQNQGKQLNGAVHNGTNDRLNAYEIEYAMSKFDMTLVVVEETEGLQFLIEYCSGLFNKESVSRFAGYFKRILNSISGSPEIEIAGIDILSGEEKERLIHAFNDTRVDFPADRSVYELFAGQVKKVPNHTAVVFDDTSVTYNELDARCCRLARLLAGKGVKSNTVTGIMMERSIEMAIGLLGILAAGGAYLPIDPANPNERNAYMLSDSCAHLLLKNRGAGEKVTEPGLWQGETVDMAYVNFVTAVGKQKKNFQVEHSPADLAYVIYTSGTSGRPKGVLAEHRNVVNVVTWFGRQYKIKPGSRVLQMSNYTFDASVNQVFGTLLHGASLHIVDRNLLLDIEALRRYIDEKEINLINSVPQLLKELLASGPVLKPLKVVISGADALDDTAKDRILKKGYRLVNHYGPSEATIDALAAECTGAKVVLGRPIANTSCYIRDKYGKTLPDGIAGELVISGAGLTRGYLNRPELTAEKFVIESEPDNISLHPSSGSLARRLVYCTGDRTRRLPDGNIEFLGRTDDQVKIRGFRVELREIERKLSAYREINEAAVVIRRDNNGENHLCAYFVSEKEISSGELRGYLSKTLPDYMIPSYFIGIDRLPLTANGKIDRNALPEAGVTLSGEYTAPRNKMEEALLQIWAEVLGIDRETIGIDGNFFELGGHSLKSFQVVSRIRKELGVQVDIRDLFLFPTIKELQKKLRKPAKTGGMIIHSRPKKEYYDISYNQQALWLHSLFDEENILFNIPEAVLIKRKLNVRYIRNSIRHIVDKHEILRTYFVMIEGQLKQRISRDVNVGVDFLDFSTERDSMSRAEREIAKRITIPFDIGQPPLLRITLFRLSEDKHIFLLETHHFVFDGLSLQRFMTELFDTYRSLSVNKKVTPGELCIQYKDFTIWQKEWLAGPAAAKHREYWLDRLSGDIPKLNLDPGYRETGAPGVTGRGTGFEIDEKIVRDLYRLCAGFNMTLFNFLLAVVFLLLHKYTQQDDIIIGVDMAGRTCPDTEMLIGLFINTVPLRIIYKPGMTFESLLKEVKELLLGAFNHQEYPVSLLISDLKKELKSIPFPLFDVLVSMQNSGVGSLANDFPGAERFPLQYSKIHFSLCFDFLESGETILGSISYAADRFRPEFMELVKIRFLKLVEELSKTPGTLIADIRLFSGIPEGVEETAGIEFNL